MAMDPDLEAKYARNGKVMVASALLLFIVLFIFILFRTYLCLCRRRRRRLLSHDPLTTTTTTSKEERLDPSVLKSLPTFTYSSSSATHRHLHDCAVCLSEFADADEGRTLPSCDHAFHSHCIDAWFASHSNCPLCRAPVQPATVSSHAEPGSVSVSEPGEGCSSFPEPIGCPIKPLGIIIELPVPVPVPEEIRGSDPVPGDIGFKCSLKRICSV